MTILTTILTIDRNEAPENIVANLDTVLQGLGAISIVALQLRFRARPSITIREVTLTYRTPGPVEYRAEYLDSDAAADAFFAADTDRRGHYLLDLSPRSRRSLEQTSLALIYSEDFESPVQGIASDPARSRFVQPSGNIASGASGQAFLLTSSGPIATFIEVTNIWDSTWLATERGTAVLDPVTGEWLGQPTC